MLVGLCAGLTASVAHALHNEMAVRAILGVVAALGVGATVSLVSGPGGHGAVVIVVTVAAAATGAVLAALLGAPRALTARRRRGLAQVAVAGVAHTSTCPMTRRHLELSS
jgi:uncharacterized integral membrane protein